MFPSGTKKQDGGSDSHQHVHGWHFDQMWYITFVLHAYEPPSTSGGGVDGAVKGQQFWQTADQSLSHTWLLTCPSKDVVTETGILSKIMFF